MGKRTCSVIIPTFNNAPIIPLTLDALTSQAIPDNWQMEIVLSDDGSTDATCQVASHYAKDNRQAIQVIAGRHAGPAQARQRGLAKAAGEVVLLLGADILLRPGAFAAHCLFHEKNSNPATAALGIVKWDPRLAPSPLMEWMTHSGQQNDFDALLGTYEANPQHFFYGSHVSLKRAFMHNLPKEAFFTHFGFEDLHLGQFLKKRGLQLRVLHKAMGLHHHFYSISDICQRQERVGVAFVDYHKQHHTPMMKRTRVRQLMRWLYIKSSLPTCLKAVIWACQGVSLVTPRVYKLLTVSFFWRGITKVTIFFPN